VPEAVSFVALRDPSGGRAEIQSRLAEAGAEVALVLGQDRPVMVLSRDGRAEQIGREGRLLDQDGGGPAFRAGHYVVSGSDGAWTVTKGSTHLVRPQAARAGVGRETFLRLPGRPLAAPDMEVAYECELGHVVWHRSSDARRRCPQDATRLSR
jgi:hypothetical protein